VRRAPIGVLPRRALVAQLARQHGTALKIADAGTADLRGLADALDGLFGELLPEAVSPDALRRALETLDGDEFCTLRNQWVVSVYDAYLRELEAMGR